MTMKLCQGTLHVHRPNAIHAPASPHPSPSHHATSGTCLTDIVAATEPSTWSAREISSGPNCSLCRPIWSTRTGSALVRSEGTTTRNPLSVRSTFPLYASVSYTHLTLPT